MPRRRTRAEAFLQRYVERLESLNTFAGYVEKYVTEEIRPLHLDVHQISARAKSLESVAGKIRRKQYGSPAQQLTDQVGVRVILYYGRDVDIATQKLRSVFDIDPKRSVDKRRTLGVRQFGYRSVHLLARMRGRPSQAIYEPFWDMWFEIQVRSILDHAWAEIEHELCYKSGIAFPEDVLRSFGAVAGALELADSHFQMLRGVRDELTEKYRALYSQKKQLDDKLDALRLIAAFEAAYPEAEGWRRRGEVTIFPIGSEVACLEALRDVGIETARQLLKKLKSRSVREAVGRFASLSGVAPVEVSHMARAVLLAGIANRDAIRRYPELLEDGNIRTALRLQ